MKFTHISLLVAGVLASTNIHAQVKKSASTTIKAAQVTSINQPILKNTQDSLSYALGIDVASNLKNAGFTIDPEIFKEGLKAALNGDSLILNEDKKMQIIQQEFQKAYDKKVEEKKKPGEDFLAQNKLRPEVKTTPEGIQYEILREGNGERPSEDSEVEVHYMGTLIDGTQFDSSYERNEPLKLFLNRVIEGWKIGIPLMRVGSKYKFYIPQHLAYGEREAGVIPPFSTLIFEVELLKKL